MKPVFDFSLIALRSHVDEIYDQESAEVTQSALPGNFVRGLEIRGQGGCFDIAALGCPGGIDIDRDQRFGMVDNDASTRWQMNRMGKCRFDLTFDLIPGE